MAVWHKGYRGIILEHIESNVLCYVLVLVAFVAGLILGSVSVNALDANARKDLLAYLTVFIRDLVTDDAAVSSREILYAALSNNLRTVAAIWLLGVTVIGIPAILLIIIVRGFVLGFTVAFLVNEMGTEGFTFSVMSILPHNILAVPGLMLAAGSALGFSFMIVGEKRAGKKIDFLGEFLKYSKWAAAAAILFCGASLVEAYFTPTFMKVVSPHLAP